VSYRFHHVHIICRNLDITEQFFIQNFDAIVEGRTNFGVTPGSLLNLNGAMIYLRLKKDNEVFLGDGEKKGFGYDHIGLELDDMDTAYKQLTSNGVAFMMPPKKTATGGQIAFALGPDNIIIELYQPEP
jgi:glyoxylase I family protein